MKFRFVLLDLSGISRTSMIPVILHIHFAILVKHI